MYVATTEALARRPAILARGQLVGESAQSRASLVCGSRAIQSAIHDPIRTASTRLSLEPVRLMSRSVAMRSDCETSARRGTSMPVLDSLEPLALIVEYRITRQAANGRSFAASFLSTPAGEIHGSIREEEKSYKGSVLWSSGRVFLRSDLALCDKKM